MPSTTISLKKYPGHDTIRSGSDAKGFAIKINWLMHFEWSHGLAKYEIPDTINWSHLWLGNVIEAVDPMASHGIAAPSIRAQ